LTNRDPFNLPANQYSGGRVRLAIALAADVVTLGVVVAAGWLDDVSRSLLGLLLLAVIGGALVVTHLDIGIVWARGVVARLAWYGNLYNAYRQALARAASAEARLLLAGKKNVVGVVGTAVRDGRVALILAANKRGISGGMSVGDTLSIINEVRREVWGKVEVAEVTGERAYARVIDYSPNPIFWGLLESRREYDASFPPGVIAIKHSEGD